MLYFGLVLLLLGLITLAIKKRVDPFDLNPSGFLTTTIGILALFGFGFVVGSYVFPSRESGESRKANHFLVKKSELGAAWPYPTYNDGSVYCLVKNHQGARRPLVLIVLGNVTYGLNGAATSTGGFPAARSLTPKDEDYGFAPEMVSTVQTWIESALQNCD